MSKVIWITGISGVGKTTLAKYYLKFLNNYIWIDGDKFRDLFNNDIKYSLRDRNINAERLIKFVSFLNKQKFNTIISANLTSNKYKKRIRKFKKLYNIQIEADMHLLKKRDKKKIYMKNKNVVGKDIKVIKNYKFSDYVIFNNASKKEFLTKGFLILKDIKNK
tara:strand:+ start:2260 stop:2748 length:489 start_codon:yes stop_codon:yes gene_type:complete